MALRRSFFLLLFSTSIIMLCFLPLSVAAQDRGEDSIIHNITGFVEIRYPGEDWISASEGDALTPDTIISTSFDSAATILIGNRGVIEVQPLSRLTIKDLAESADLLSTDLYLEFGRIDAQVNTGGEVEHHFSLRTSVSVASVRGTRFLGDGETWTAAEGSVRVENQAGRAVTITAGESLRITGIASFLRPQLLKEKQSTVAPYTNPVDTAEDKVHFIGGERNSSQTVVTISWL